MAKNDVATDSTTQAGDQRYPVEELAVRNGTDPGVLAGMMEHRRYASGKALTEAEYTTALAEFLGAPAAARLQRS
jgi:hypothetical protein